MEVRNQSPSFELILIKQVNLKFKLHKSSLDLPCEYFVYFEQVGMLFVRCRGGISHSPAEHVLDDDVWAAGLALLSFLETQL